ncbi:reverse transcriptase domain-containing protein [Tanacetum coccineum]
MSARPKTLDFAFELANDLMDQKLCTYAERQNKNKRKADDSSINNHQQQPHKKQNVARAYTAGPGEKKVYTGDLPLCTKCNYHHTGQCAPKCGKCKRYGHATTDYRVNTNNNKNQKAGACYECGNVGHMRRDCPKLKNHGNGNGNGTAQGRAYALGRRDASLDSNVITGMFLLNNRYAKILFDTGADRSFVSSSFSASISITPTTLENHYDIELADGKIIGVNTIIRGCTLNFMNYLFNIDFIPVSLSSFDVIIGMDWLTKYHGVMEGIQGMSVSSDSNGPSSWGIPLVNAGELPEMDPYEEVAQQGQAHPLLPTYVPDPMELDEHVPVYVPEPEHPEYHAPSDDDIQVEDQPYVDDASPTTESPGYIADSDSIEEDTDADSIDYPDEPEDGEEDDEDPEEDPSEEHEPEDDDDDDDTNDEDEEPTEDEEEDRHPASADSSAIPVVDPVPSAGDTEAFETDESAPTPRSPQTRARIDEHVVAHIPPTNPTYDQAPLGHRASIIRMRDDILEEDMPPRRRFILAAPPPGCDVAESSAAATRAPRAADRVEDVGYVRALQASEHRMMTSIEEVNLRVSYQAHVRRKESEDFYTQLLDARTDHRDIRLEIDVVRGQRTAYETELHEVCQAYLSSEAQNRALLARLETLETHMSPMEWQRQRAEDDAVRKIMRTQVLDARDRIDTVEDAGSSC